MEERVIGTTVIKHVGFGYSKKFVIVNDAKLTTSSELGISELQRFSNSRLTVRLMVWRIDDVRRLRGVPVLPRRPLILCPLQFELSSVSDYRGVGARMSEARCIAAKSAVVKVLGVIVIFVTVVTV